MQDDVNQPESTNPPVESATPVPMASSQEPVEPTVEPVAPAAEPAEPVAESVPPHVEPPEAAPTRATSAAQEIEGTIREKGENLEAAARQLGANLDEKLMSSETGREVKQKVGGLWNRIKETIK